jgi:hypothetical protein
MSCASFSSVDVIDGQLIYWFLFEDTEPHTGYYFDGVGYGIGVDEQHQIIEVYNENKNTDGSNSRVDMTSVEGIAILHAIQNNKRLGWIDVEFIKLGAGYLCDIMVDSMAGSIAESLFPGEELARVDFIEAVLDTVVDTEIETDPTPPLSSLKVH